MMYKKLIPQFPKKIRDEILTFTDDKKNKAMVKCADTDKEIVILAGAKKTGKSFAFPCIAIWNIINNSKYCAVMARNFNNRVIDTLIAVFNEFLQFLKNKYDIDYTDLFEVRISERSIKFAEFKPTGQKIFFGSFEAFDRWAGFNPGFSGAFIGDVFLDEVMEMRSGFEGKSQAQIDKFYQKQLENFDVIKQSTITRFERNIPNNFNCHIYISCNLWEREHWLVKKYFDKVLPLTNENLLKLEKEHFILRESKELNCVILRLSIWYIPKEFLGPRTLADIEDKKKHNYQIYLVTYLGESYLEVAHDDLKPFKQYCLNEFGGVDEKLLFDLDSLKTNDIEFVIDGYDPGLRDKNGLVRILISKDWKIYVLFAEEFSSNKWKNYKRMNSSKYVIEKCNSWNLMLGNEYSLLAIDNKDDAVFEMLQKANEDLNPENNSNDTWIDVRKSVKNKNSIFPIDFSINNRTQFIKNCFQLEILKFSPMSTVLIKYLSLVQLKDETEKSRDEKTFAQIYNLINAFEYALSLIYHLIIQYYDDTNALITGGII